MQCGFPSGMFLRNRYWLAFLCITAIALVTFTARISTGHQVPWIGKAMSEPAKPCPNDLNWLKSINVAYPVKYARRDIAVIPSSDVPRSSVSKVDEELLPDFQTLDLSQDSEVELKHCRDPVELHVPAWPESVDASHMIFGISTTLERLENTVPSLLRWLPHSRARLYVIVIEMEQHDDVQAIAADGAKKKELEAKMRDLGMDVTLVEPLDLQESFSEKYFSLVKIMWDHRDERTQWVGVLDDDTFLPSLPALMAMLGKYDPSKKYYVGALSEDWWSVAHYGMMAFGGAGVFLSHAMAESINKNYKLCRETSHTSAGDIRILECINSISTIKITNERDLHQIDLWGDLSGLFENGRLLLSLHHWKPGGASDNGYDLPMMHIVADVCKECFLQRWWFKNDWLLTNGFSVASYPLGDLPKANLDFMEFTWNPVREVDFSINSGIDHSLGPTRPKLDLEKQKIQYTIIASAAVDGGVRQAYLRKGFEGEMDSLLEFFWYEKK